MNAVRVACVGAVIRDERGRVLLVQRGRDPGRGLWSIPGGRVEDGETSQEALAREVAEETGLTVDIGSLAGVVERPGPAGEIYVIEDFFARPRIGTDPHAVRAGDDADDVRWVHADELTALPCVDGLREALTDWRVIPRQR